MEKLLDVTRLSFVLPFDYFLVFLESGSDVRPLHSCCCDCRRRKWNRMLPYFSLSENEDSY